jgi:hypothetical protein
MSTTDSTLMSPTTPRPNFVKKRNVKRANVSPSKVTTDIDVAMMEYMRSQTTSKKEEDEAQLLADSYVPCLRRLNARDRMGVDIKIRQLLYEAEFQTQSPSKRSAFSSGCGSVPEQMYPQPVQRTRYCSLMHADNSTSLLNMQDPEQSGYDQRSLSRDVNSESGPQYSLYNILT